MFVVDCKLIFRRHHQTMGWAGIRAQIAVAAKRHIDVELGYPQFDRSSVRGENRKVFLSPLLRRHVDTINRTGTHALATSNAILNLVEKAHPGSFRKFPSLVRILQSHCPRPQVEQGDSHSHKNSPNCLKDIFKVLLHEASTQEEFYFIAKAPCRITRTKEMGSKTFQQTYIS